MDLNLTQVRSFVAVVRYGGYHRAAEALHLTQPAVSRHVRALEAALGAPVFERRGRGVEPTAFGERSVRELEALLRAHDTALARLGGTERRPFVLGAVEHVVDPVLPDLLATVRGAVSERGVQLRVDRSHALVERVARGDVDAAIVMHPHAARDPIELGVILLRWYGDPALAARAATGLPDPFPLVTYDPPCGHRDTALGILEGAGLAVTITAESPHLSGVQAAVRHGLGYTLLAGGADGLRPVTGGVFGTPVLTPLFLVLADGHRALAQPLRAALWRAMHRRPVAAA